MKEPRMSTDEPTGPGLPRGLLVTAGLGAVAVVAAFLYLTFGNPYKPPPPDKDSKPSLARDDPLEVARETLSRATDLNACRAARQQLNAYLTEDAQNRPPVLSEEARKRLQALADLTADELIEVESGT